MRIKLIASFLLIVLTAIGIFIVVTLRQTAQEVSNFIERRGLTGSEVVVSALEQYYEDHHSWNGVADVLRNSPQVPRFGMWGPGMGRNQLQDVDGPRLNLRLADAHGKLMAHTEEGVSKPRQQLTQYELQRAVPLEVNGDTVGFLIAEGGQPFSPANEISLLSRLNQAAIVAVAIAGIVAVSLGLLLSYSLSRPVLDLTKAASHLAAGDLSQRVDVKGKDELAALGRTFNNMAESLQVAQKSRQAMTADIAHELRTPLAVQRAHLEAIEDKVYPLTIENLSTIEEQNKLLTRLVEDLGTLALADAGQLELQISLTDFPDLIRRVTSPFIPQAAEREIDIKLFLADCPPLSIDSQRIQQILHNLMSNALRFTPDSGRILVLLSLQNNDALQLDTNMVDTHESDSEFIVLEVRDNGSGIPNEALPRIFDRFYRADKSRTRLGGGSGLGLSIARKLAQAHGGDLTAANLPEGGAVFSLILPPSTITIDHMVGY